MSCIFCKISRKEIPSQLIYEDEKMVAFHDIDPKAPVHFLVIPKEHVASLNDVDNQQLAGELLFRAKELAKEKGIDQTGYRVVVNANEDGGQTVFHLHLHVMGGRKMLWPPG